VKPELDPADVIGNCTRGVLIDRRGRYVWCCYPRLDGDPIFCNLLRDAAGDGLFDVEIERLTSSHQYYLGKSAILITVLSDEAGATLRITDFAPRFKHYERLSRPAMLIRRIEPRRRDVSGADQDAASVRLRIDRAFASAREQSSQFCFHRSRGPFHH
jgi:GH15 family glucan-1,4-alpha-glucosidase